MNEAFSLFLFSSWLSLCSMIHSVRDGWPRCDAGLADAAHNTTQLSKPAPSSQKWAFTRYCFTSRRLCTRLNHLFIAHPHLHCPHYCNTIARLLRNRRHPPTPLWNAIQHTILMMTISCEGQARNSSSPTHRRRKRTREQSEHRAYTLTD